MPPSLLWRRKSSTPFFPGAWPNSSVSSYHDTSVSVPNDDLPPQLPELLHIRPQNPGNTEDGVQVERGLGWSFPTALETHPFEDNVALGGNWQGRKSVGDSNPLPAMLSSPDSVSAPLSASFSQDSNFTEASDSEGALTPDSLNRAPWLPILPDGAQQTKTEFPLQSHFQVENSFSSSLSSRHDTIISPIPINANIPPSTLVNNHNFPSNVATTYPQSPLLDFVPPLTLSTLSLNLTSISYPSDAENADHPPAPPPTHPAFESTSSSFAIPSPEAEETTFHSPVRMASTFFPVSNVDPFLKKRVAASHASSSSSSPSAYSLADSPVLPTEGNPGHSPSPQPELPSSVAIAGPSFSPTSADLDAFARAAAAAASAESSSMSVSSSLRSAADPGPSRVGAPPHGRAYTEESGVPSLTLAVAACQSTTTEFGRELESAHEYVECFECQGGCDCPLRPELEDAARDGIEQAERAQRRSVPTFDTPRFPVYSPVIPVPPQRTISSRVDIGHDELGMRTRLGLSRERPVKLLVLGRMKKIGGRILGLFTGGKTGGTKSMHVDGGEQGKSAENELEGVRRTMTTAVTKVEYESEHPIPVSEAPVRNARVSLRSLVLPISISPSHSPRRLRQDSFLPMDDEPVPRTLLSRPFHHMRMRASAPAQVTLTDRLEGPTHIATTGDVPARRLTRARTQTAPPAQSGSSTRPISDSVEDKKKVRRFSLSSALSKSRLEALKTTVVPHPPVPAFPRSSTTEPGIGPSADRPMRPTSMMIGSRLDTRHGERCTGVRQGVQGIEVKSEKEKGKRPASMFVQRGGPGHTLSNSSLSWGEGQVDDSSVQQVKRPVRPTSMPVGKDRTTRESWVEVSGSRFKLHQPADSKREEAAAVKTDDTPVSLVPSVPEVESSVKPLSPPTSATQDRLGDPATIDLHGESKMDPLPQAQDKASRRFSFSSAISKRAMRARSMIISVGRRNSDVDCTAIPNTPTTPPRETRRARGSTFNTIIDAGVRFDMFTPGFGFTPPRTLRQEPVSPTSVRRSNDLDFRIDRERRSYDVPRVEECTRPESELDSMSFANTATMQESEGFGSVFDVDFDALSCLESGGHVRDTAVDAGEGSHALVQGPLAAPELGEAFQESSH